MRDPNRIKPFLEKLGKVWEEEFPDWRFMQLITNIQCSFGTDGFYLEDDRFLNMLEAFAHVNLSDEGKE